MASANRLRLLVLAGFFVSGATGLIYQNIWIRMLTLVVGGTTAALTTILIAFMGGLALGSWLFGALADRSRHPLRVYAVVEAGIGLYALCIPLAFRAVPGIYHALHAVDPAHGPLFHGLRFALAVAFFGIPSTLMGGTLPLIIRALSSGIASVQLTVSTAYAINTFGATVGAFMTGFLVIPTLGLDLTLQATAAVNLGLAVLFWAGLGPALSRSGAAVAAEAQALEPEGRPRQRLLVVFFLMGASSLSYEILWSRILGLSFGSSVYAISTMLTAFLAGIGLGSWWYRRREGAAPDLGTLARIEIGIAAAGLVTVLALTQLPWVVQYLYLLPFVFTQVLGAGASDLGFWFLQAGLFVVATAVMVVPTSLMGASFPVAIRLYADGGIGRSVGRVYASNTFGSILGSALTGFVLIEAIGTRASLLGWTAVNLVLGIVLLIAQGRTTTSMAKPILGVAGTLALAAVVPAVWNLDTLTSGVYYHVMGMEREQDRGDVSFSAEDDMALVSLHQRRSWDEAGPIQVMRINGKFMADDGARVTMLALFAHTPLYVRGDGAERAMVIGLGGGYTAQAALTHPLKQVDVLEISHAVVEAARVMNPRLFGDPRLNVVEEDARSFLLTGDVPYDVIISETSDPWITGVSNLYTEECFRWISNRLAPGGVFGTWLQTRHKTVEDVRTILRTMHAVFPHMAVFQFAEGDTVLVMSNDPLRLDIPAMAARFDAIQAPMNDIGIYDPWHVPGGLILGEDSLSAYLGDGPVNTDDLPIIEFSTPRSLNIGLKGREVWDDLIAHAPQRPDLDTRGLDPAGDLLWQSRRQGFMGHDAEALEALRSARALGGSPEPVFEGKLLLRLGRLDEALDLARSLPPSPRQALLEAAALTLSGRYDEVEAHLRDAPGWQDPVDRWDARILQRRKVLAEGLGMPLPPAPSMP